MIYAGPFRGKTSPEHSRIFTNGDYAIRVVDEDAFWKLQYGMKLGPKLTPTDFHVETPFPALFAGAYVCQETELSQLPPEWLREHFSDNNRRELPPLTQEQRKELLPYGAAVREGVARLLANGEVQFQERKPGSKIRVLTHQMYVQRLAQETG